MLPWPPNTVHTRLQQHRSILAAARSARRARRWVLRDHGRSRAEAGLV